MKILGLDISMTNTGWVVVETHKGLLRSIAGDVIVTKKDDDAKMSATSDALRRAGDQYAALNGVVLGHEPDVICAEAMSWPRNASSSIKMALVWGALSALSRQHGLTVVSVMPMIVKRRVAGSKTASKDDMARALAQSARFSPGDTRAAILAAIPQSRQEHVVDAFAVCQACLEAPEIMGLMRALG